MTILERARKTYNDACEARDAALDELEQATPETPAEDAEALIASADEAQATVERCKQEKDRLERIFEARANTPPVDIPDDDQSSAVVVPGNFARVKGGKVEHTYRPDNDTSFFRDLWRGSKGDTSASERLHRHDAEMRDLTTTATDGGGFVPPIYLGELYAKFPRAGRPLANALGSRPLQAKGMSITLPRITTGVATGVQTTENTTLTETELVEATVTIPVVTIGGFEDVSIQLLERSDPPIDDVVFLGLRESYDTILDNALINGSGSGATHAGLVNVTSINTTTYTDATPTAAETVPPIYETISEVATNRFRNADMIIMHPRRAAWLAGTLSANQSLFQLGSLTNAVGQQDQGFVGNFAGLRVVLDPNVTITNGASTNEDQIIAVYSPDLILWEGDLRAEVFRETLSGEATVRLRLYAFSAFASERYPSAISVLSGTGLVTPTFA